MRLRPGGRELEERSCGRSPCDGVHHASLDDADHRRVRPCRLREVSADPGAGEPFVTFVLGPRLTDGAVILRCQVYEPTLFDACDLAERQNGMPSQCGDHATLGYICGGSTVQLQELQEKLMTIDAPPLAAQTSHLRFARTVNKSLRARYPDVALRSPKGPVLAAGGLRDRVERAECGDALQLQRLLTSVRFTYATTARR